MGDAASSDVNDGENDEGLGKSRLDDSTYSSGVRRPQGIRDKPEKPPKSDTFIAFSVSTKAV